MKSITQINLARLTVRKSLSKSDSGILQAWWLIAIGGAIFPSSLTLNFPTLSPRLPTTTTEKYLPLEKVVSNSFFLAAFQYCTGARNLSTAPNEMQIALLAVSHLAELFLKIFICVSTIKMNNCHSIAHFAGTGAPIAKIYISK